MSQPAETGARIRELTLGYRGDFDLRLSVGRARQAVFVERDGADTDGLDLAFLVEGTWAPVAVRVEQVGAGGPVRARILDNPQAATDEQLREQLERILSLAPDGRRLDDVAAADPVAGSLVDRFRGLRPIAFPSPYEAAARAIVGHRLALPAAAAAFARVAEAHGTPLHLHGRELRTFAAPDRLARLEPVRGLSERKIGQLRSLGEAAAAGELISAQLMGLARAEAMARLQELPGIGPFSAELVLIRGCGDPDVFPRTEGRLHRAIADSYGLGPDPGLPALEAAAEAWRPLRSWVGLMARSASDDRSTGSAAA